jgi:hypothetical protein
MGESKLRRGAGLQLCAAHAVTDADQRVRHLVALQVDQVRQVPCVVKPAGCMRSVAVL